MGYAHLKAWKLAGSAARFPHRFSRAVAGELDEPLSGRFGALWQNRVRALLLEHADRVVTVADWHAEKLHA